MTGPGVEPAAAPSSHRPVMLAEVLALFREMQHPPRVVVDGTVGLGGHAASMLAARADVEVLLGLDRDPEALQMAGERLASARPPDGRVPQVRIELVHGGFERLPQVLEAAGLAQVDFILLDLGVSTLQFKSAHRGFALKLDGPLDMRMDPSCGPTARELLERSSREQIETWLREFGEAPFAGRIARVLHERRHLLATTGQLVQAVLDALPAAERHPRRGDVHPATQTFQALRIATNRELTALDAVLPAALEVLAPLGRLAVISFQSLEDRRVKQAFELASRDCICPPRLPACGCGHRRSVRLLTRRALQPTAAEIDANPPSRSARLRAVERL
ncbi:MAG: 16S rRNA (cytosine(1402)-N(4))-methyltransferase RsmH [Candidatus Riflebacteria bacterium]|nr:16S rRNA (cytosine(1402)-N(4))-methyltransferase RsmH [Candidatus Riflebacteria bacterium]